MLPLVVLTHMITRNSESMVSSIMNMLYTNTPVYDFESSTQRFRSSTVMSSDDSTLQEKQAAAAGLLRRVQKQPL